MDIKRKKYVLIMFLLITFTFVSQDVHAMENKEVNIDKTFDDLAYWLKSKSYDKNQDGYLSKKEIREIKTLHCHGDWGEAISLKGISKLKYLENLDLYAKRMTSMKEIKKLYRLKKIKIEVHQKNKTKINISQKNNIKKLYLYNVNNSATIAGKCSKLERLIISGDKTSKKLIVKNNKRLKSVCIYGGINALERITLKSCQNLKKIEIDSETKLKKLKKFELVNNKNIKSIRITNQCPNISSFILKNLPNLKEIDVRKNNFIKRLRLENVPQLTQLYWENGKLENIEITGSNTLEKLHVSNNNFVKFDHPEMKNLYELYINKNKLTGLFNMDNYPEASCFYLDDNNITEIYGGDLWIYNGKALSCNNNKELKLIYLPYCYFSFFYCKVPNVKAYVTFNKGVYGDTAEIIQNYDWRKGLYHHDS